MRIGRASTWLSPYKGCSTNSIGQYPDTDLYLELTEAACAFREKGGGQKEAVTLINALAHFMSKAEIFKPINEVWDEICRNHRMLPDGFQPNSHELAGERGIYLEPDFVKREIDQWEERAILVLSQELNWGIAWLPEKSPRKGPTSDEDWPRLLQAHYNFERTTPKEIAKLGFNSGGGQWGMANTLARAIVIARDNAEKRYKHLFGMAQSIIVAEQICNLKL